MGCLKSLCASTAAAGKGEVRGVQLVTVYNLTAKYHFILDFYIEIKTTRMLTFLSPSTPIMSPSDWLVTIVFAGGGGRDLGLVLKMARVISWSSLGKENCPVCPLTNSS